MACLGMGCRGRETLQNLCDQIPGDALLYSMFKVDAEPIKCPIRGMSGKYLQPKNKNGKDQPRMFSDEIEHDKNFNNGQTTFLPFHRTIYL
jgi:hypothetical protein